MTWVIGGIVAVFFIWVIWAYNAFIRAKNQVENAWSQIDVQLKRRTDLIPNLINTVKGYAKHEKTVLENVTNARASLMSAQKSGDPKKAAQADGELAGALKSLFAVSENYPDLKASQNFQQLQEELTGTENKVAASRQYYNDMVQEYQVRKQSFPTNIIAGVFNFGDKEFFDIPEGEKEVPKVEF